MASKNSKKNAAQTPAAPAGFCRYCASLKTPPAKCPVCRREHAATAPRGGFVEVLRPVVEAPADLRERAITSARNLWNAGQRTAAIALLVGLANPEARERRLAFLAEYDAAGLARKLTTAMIDARARLLDDVMREAGIERKNFKPTAPATPPAPVRDPGPVTVQVTPRPAGFAIPPAPAATPAPAAPSAPSNVLPLPARAALPAVGEDSGPLVGGDWRGLWVRVTRGTLTEADAKAIAAEWLAAGVKVSQG